MEFSRDSIFLIVGESGSGKDTIVNQVVQSHGVARIDSYTTRPSRGEGDRHIFVDSLRSWANSHDYSPIVGYTRYKGHDYWATEKQVENSDLYIIDPAGVRYFKTAYKGKKKVKVVYLSVPAHVRLERMLNRGDGLFKAVQRLWHDMFVFRGADKLADFVIYDGFVSDNADALWKYMTW